MSWKAIGHSIIGISHTAAGKSCEDAIAYKTITDTAGNEVLICCVSDGAGSAQYAAWASDHTVHEALALAAHAIVSNEPLTEELAYALAEDIYDALLQEAAAQGVDTNEYSCTLLGCIVAHNKALFFQVGDGAIVRNDGSNFYITQWWPHNGEYQNTTSFIIDDPHFAHLQVAVIEGQVNEIAIFSDGLQMLALSMEGRSVHQPFFTDLFRYLRMADTPEKVMVLNKKLAEYLGSRQINERTDDDKTLFLATRHTS